MSIIIFPPSIEIRGTNASDNLKGTKNSDSIFGLNGNDSLFGKQGRDSLFGGNGRDLLKGGRGDDLLFGDFDDDLLFGGAGKDELNGGFGEDFLDGGNGNDILVGGDGNDILVGGAGDDRLLGGESNPIVILIFPPPPPARNNQVDVLTGGRGADTFVLSTLGPADGPIVPYFGDGFAIITDFNRAEGDRIELLGSPLNNNYRFDNTLGGTKISLDGDLIAFVANAEIDRHVDVNFVGQFVPPITPIF